MIFDVLVSLIALASVISGYREGFIKSLLKTAGYIAGAITGLYFAIQYDKSAWVILAIFLGAGVGSFLGQLIAKALKLTIIRGPLAWINSLAGAALGGAKIALLAYLVGTVLILAPWNAGNKALQESAIYPKLEKYAPQQILDLKVRVEEAITNPLK